MLPAGGLPHLPRLDRGAEGADRLDANLPCPSPAAALLPEVGREDESPTASPTPRLAFAAAWPARATGLRSEISRAASLAGTFHDPIGH